MMSCKPGKSEGSTRAGKTSAVRRRIGSRSAIWFTPVIVGVLAVAPAMATDVIRGIDLWKSESPTEKDFLDCPIMAGFFDPGSDPFNGTIQFRGRPFGGVLGDTDTIVERLANAPLPCPVFEPPNPPDCGIPPCPGSLDPPCSQATVSIQIVALSLESAAPVTVTYGGGSPEAWDVRACLSDQAQPLGTMTITHNCPEGGTFASTLPVRFKLIFTRQRDGAVRVLDAGLLPDGSSCNPIVFDAQGDWDHSSQGLTHAVLPGIQVDGNCDGALDPQLPGTTNFFPGIKPEPCVSCCEGLKDRAVKQVVQEEVADDETKHAVTPPPPGVPPPPIPAVSTWGLLVMTLLLLAAGKVYYGRRRQPVM